MKKIKILLIFGVLAVVLAACRNENLSENASHSAQTPTGETSTKEASTQEETSSDNPVMQGKASTEESTAKDTPSEALKDEVFYPMEDYGTIEIKQADYLDANGEIAFFYTLECFSFSDSFPAVLNQTLQEFYDALDSEYKEWAEDAGMTAGEASGGAAPYTPYELLHFLNIWYVGEDYVSILYNHVTYIGGAHPYSWYDGITIDCRTGEQISASELLGKSDDAILQEISSKMGLDATATWDDVDFYLTDSNIVFFYRMPQYWEDVVLPRVH